MIEKDTKQFFFGENKVIVEMPEELHSDVKRGVFRYIERNHYRGVPRQDDGEVNPYQYCYGVGYVIDGNQMFGGMISGYPTQAFQHYADHIVDELGNPWVSEHVANIYRIVAHYPTHADALLEKYEKVASKRGIKILYSLPTKEEKDAVCNFDWFERNGFNYYAETKDENARFYVKQIGELPTIPADMGFTKGREYKSPNVVTGKLDPISENLAGE
jgi:hypothetical protein